MTILVTVRTQYAAQAHGLLVSLEGVTQVTQVPDDRPEVGLTSFLCEGDVYLFRLRRELYPLGPSSVIQAARL